MLKLFWNFFIFFLKFFFFFADHFYFFLINGLWEMQYWHLKDNQCPRGGDVSMYRVGKIKGDADIDRNQYAFLSAFSSVRVSIQGSIYTRVEEIGVLGTSSSACLWAFLCVFCVHLWSIVYTKLITVYVYIYIVCVYIYIYIIIYNTKWIYYNLIYGMYNYNKAWIYF